MFEENLDTFFTDFAVEGVINNVLTVKVLFDQFSDPLQLGVEGREIKVTVKTSDIPNIEHQDTIRVSEITYTIVGINPTMDGQITELLLKNL